MRRVVLSIAMGLCLFLLAGSRLASAETVSAGGEPTRGEMARLAAERAEALEAWLDAGPSAETAALKPPYPGPAIRTWTPQAPPVVFRGPTIVQPEHDALIRSFIELYYRRF